MGVDMTTKFVSAFKFITYCLITNDKQLKKFRKEYGIGKHELKAPTKDARVDFLQFEQGQFAVMQIRVSEYDLHEVLGLLAHECVHIKQHVMLDIGEHDPSDEFEAYFVQDLTTNIFNEYFKLTAK